MSDIATIGFAVDTSGLAAGEVAMSKMEARAAALEKQAGSATAALERMARISADAMAKVPAGMGGGGASGGMYGPGWQQSLTGATSGYVGLAAAAEGAAKATVGHAAAATEAAHATERTTGALAAGTAAHKAHGAAAYGNRLQMMELAHVGRSLFDELASGGSIVRGLAMEFGRLQIAVTSGEGGISGMLGRIGGLAGKLANPFALATGGVVALGTASAYSFSRYEEGQEALERSLNGRGRGNGMTQTQLNAMARSSAAAGGLSNSEGVGLIARYTGAGLSGDLAGQLTGLSKEYGRISGDGTEKGADTLSKAFADPIRGLGDLDRSLGFVDARLKDQIEDLVHSGQLGRAQALELDAVTKAMHGASDATWTFSKAMDGAGNWLSNRFDQLGHGVAGALGYGSDADKLAEMRTRADNLERVDPLGNRDYVAELRKQMLPLMASVSASEKNAAEQARDKVERDKSGSVTDAVRAALPDLARARSTADTLSLLRDAMGDPDIRRFVSPDVASSLGRAYDNTSMLARMNAPGVADRQNYEMRLSGIRDSGVEDTGLNAARRTELEILRQTGDVVRAATEAQRSLNIEIAKSNEEAEERLRQAKQDGGLIGLSPYDRAKQQLRNEYLGDRGIIEQSRFDKGGTDIRNDAAIKGDLGGFTPARQAVTGFSDALDGAAKRLAAFPAAGAAAGPFGTLDRGAFAGSPSLTGAFGHAPAGVQAMITSASMQTGVPAGIIAAIGERENGFRLTGATGIKDTNGRPASTAFGYGQLTDGAARDVARAVPGFDKFNPSTAVFGSAEYLKILQGRFGDMQTALDHYGTGPGYGADIMRRAGGAGGATPLTIHPSVAAVTPLAATASGVNRRAFGELDANLDRSYGSADPNAYGTPLGDSSRRLKEQSVLLDLQAAGFGKSAEATKGAVAAQTLWDSYLDSGVTKTVKLSDATGDLADHVRGYGSEVERQAAKQEEQARLQKFKVDAADFGRTSIDSTLTAGAIAAAHGQSFSKAAGGVLSGIGDQLIGKAISGTVAGFTGPMGSPFGGILGSLFGGGSLPHFAGGTSDFHGGPAVINESGPETVVLPQHSQVITAGQSGGLMAGRSSSMPPIKMGDVHFHATGDGAFSDRQMDMLAAQHAQTQQKVAADLVRNFGQYQRDAGQAG